MSLTLASCAVAPSGPSAASVRGQLLLHLAGDVSLDPSQIPAFLARGYAWAWSGLDGLLQRDDLSIVNLECPATDVVDPVSKTYSFRCDPDALPAARRAGVDVASQANNHAYDDGPEGLLDSLERVRGAGIAPVGAGRNQAEALRAATFTIDGWSVAVVGIDQVLDPLDAVAGPDRPGTAAGHDFELALGAVRRAATTADLVLVSIHWGVEGEARPRRLQVDQAHRMIDAGADVIFGSHPHVLQPVETYRGKPIFYSLGNLVWPRTSAAAAAVAEITVTPDGAIGWRLLPAEIVSDGHPVLLSGSPGIRGQRADTGRSPCRG